MAGVSIADCLSGGVHPSLLYQNCVKPPSVPSWGYFLSKRRLPKPLKNLKIKDGIIGALERA